MPILAYSSKDTMRPSVQAAWPPLCKAFEGVTNFLYFDTKNLATTGIGNMIDSAVGITGFGLALPWRYVDGSYATEKQVRGEYDRLKALGIYKQGGFTYKKHAELWLDMPVVDWLHRKKTAEFWAILTGQLPDLEKWPADAQLALMDMAWHMGPRFLGPNWPNFTKAAKAGDFTGCAAYCSTANNSPRDARHVKLYTNAAAVSYAGLNPDILWDADPVVIKAGLPALTKLSAASVAGSRPALFNLHAWYVQRMLTQTGDYKTTVDGLFGPMSKAAFSTWASGATQPNRVTRDTLTALSKATINMPVTA